MKNTNHKWHANEEPISHNDQLTTTNQSGSGNIISLYFIIIHIPRDYQTIFDPVVNQVN